MRRGLMHDGAVATKSGSLRSQPSTTGQLGVQQMRQETTTKGDGCAQ